MPLSTEHPHGPWVLVVDDEPLIRKAVRRTLQHAGLGVLTVGNADDCLRVSADQVPALVVADLHLGGMDGGELIHRLRELHGRDAPPVIVVTGEMGAEVEGAAAVLFKPFRSTELLEVVRRCTAAAAA